MLNFASQDSNDWREPSGNSIYDVASAPSFSENVSRSSIRLFADKLRTPPVSNPVARPRLTEHLDKSLAQFSTTLIAGRAGMGKTTLAAEFARQSEACVAWYKVETADCDWKVFSRYLAASLELNCSAENANLKVAASSESLAAQFVQAAEDRSVLIVLDDLHSVFDAKWFAEFFHNFVPLLAPNVRLLMTARTLPPLAQIWRLRSKQILGVLDEKLLAFTQEETVELFRQHRLTPTAARLAHKSTYGKISRLVEIIEKKSAKPNRVSV